MKQEILKGGGLKSMNMADKKYDLVLILHLIYKNITSKILENI